jgi:hypothetical protein
MAKKDYWAGPNVRGWQVKGAGNEKASSVHETQAQAWNEARRLARGSEGEAFLQGKDGQIRARNSYGTDPYPPKG